jgi:predicted negative regulator of RcsB-dependent stress response
MARRKQRHADTAAPVEGIEARIAAAFEWASEHPREVLSVLGAIVVTGALVAGVYEWQRRSQASAARALEQIEERFAQSMGADRFAAVIPEPQDGARATRSREEALAAFDQFIRSHGRSRFADFAAVRAAEMEIDLGRLGAADERLRELVEDLGSEPLLRAIALRLLGYVLEEEGQHGEAGKAYAEAAATEGYPDPAAVWLLAADAFRRAGERDQAATAYREVQQADPVYAAQKDVAALLATLGTEP